MEKQRTPIAESIKDLEVFKSMCKTQSELFIINYAISTLKNKLPILKQINYERKS